MDIEKFKDILRNNEVYFKFYKRNGDVREAKGTLNKEIVESFFATPKGTGMPYPDYIVKYFDINEEDWRSFDINNFIEIIKTDNIVEDE